ncbi:MAG: uracil-DNA glycosylase [Peptococcaceae bacterium]|nr:uracil-DNA glycosylase [Peptococcaceae bacterium]
MIGNSWDAHLDLEHLQKMLDWLGGKRTAGYRILPEENSVLKAFQLTPFEEVKVVILGQDPYPGKDKRGAWHAMGMAFSSHSEVEVPASLRNIFKELAAETGIENKTADLSKWAKQGVLLLNTVLTVEAEKGNSHKNMGWETFTTGAVRAVGRSEKPIVFMLWGKPAQKYEKFIIRDPDRSDPNKLVLKAAHPSPLSAHNGFFGCNHFVQANQFLKEKGVGAVDWRLEAMDNRQRGTPAQLR